MSYGYNGHDCIAIGVMLSRINRNQLIYSLISLCTRVLHPWIWPDTPCHSAGNLGASSMNRVQKNKVLDYFLASHQNDLTFAASIPPVTADSDQNGVHSRKETRRSQAIQIRRRRPLPDIEIHPQAILQQCRYQLLSDVHGPQCHHALRLHLRRLELFHVIVVQSDAGPGYAKMGVRFVVDWIVPVPDLRCGGRDAGKEDASEWTAGGIVRSWSGCV